MNWNSPIFLICSLAGLLLLGGSLYLLLRGVINLKGGQGVSEMHLPGGARIKTPVPALVMFVLGVFLVVVPVYKSPDLCPDLNFHKKQPLEMVKLRGKAAADADVEVYAVVDEQPANASDDFVLSVPYLQDRRYVVRYIDKAERSLLGEENFRLEPGEREHELRGVRASLKVGNQPPPIRLTQSEPDATVAAFK